MIAHRNGLFVVLAVLLVLGLVLAGCGETATATPTKAAAAATAAPAGTAVAAATATPAAPAATPTKAPKAGGILVAASSTDNTNSHFDAHAGGITGWVTNFDQCYESLFGRDPKTFAIIPKLGEKYEVSADATSITIYLRKGVKWHNIAPVNGREFTADDVKWNIERQQKANPPFSSTTYYNYIKTIDVIDKYTIKLTLTQPYASITWLISDINFAMYPRELQEQFGDKQAKTAIGTGPFMFKSYEPKVSLEFVKNPDYYIKGTPLFDGYKILYIADVAARQAAFRNGQVHLLTNQDAATKDSLGASIKGMQSIEHLGYVYILWMNNKQKPFDNVNVRKAVSLTLDRQELIKLVEGGSAELSSNFNKGTPELMKTAAEFAAMPGFRQPKDADITAAKKLLADAGYANGVTVESLAVSSVAIYGKANEVIKAQMAKAGIDWQIKVVDFAAASAALSGTAPYNVFMSTVSTRPDYDKTNYYSTQSKANNMGWGSSEVDALLTKGLAEGDSAKRIAIYKQIDDKLLDLANSPPLYQSNSFAIAQPELRDWQTTSKAPTQWHFEQLKYAWFDK